MISYSTLIQQLEDLGLRQCALVMVHASLRKTGPIEGGVETLLQALLDVIGPNGTMVMALGASEKQPFSHLHSKAHEDMGILAEVFRQHPQTQVNDHAAARFGLLGPLSQKLLESSPLHDYFGHDSLLSRFTALEGSILRLGADIDTVTLTHWAEYRANIPYKRRVRRRYVRADIGEQWIESLDDCEGIAHWDGGDDYFAQILIDFLAVGPVRIGQVGHCTAELFGARPFVDFATEWIENNLSNTTLYAP